MKKDAYYFSHDYNAANDVKCLFLRQQLGMEGYGIFWYLIESLATAGGVLPLKIIPVLAMQMQVTETKVSAVINSFDLFTVQENSFFSIRLNEHLNLRKSLSEKGKEGALLRWGNREEIRGAIGTPNGEGNAKERKGKKRKVNTKVYIPPSIEEVVTYFTDNGYSKEAAEKAHAYYSANNWKDKNDTPVKAWKQKMQGVWFKDENKQRGEGSKSLFDEKIKNTF